jgi:hypothetical protein
VLLRLPYLALTNVFTVLRLLPMSDTDKDIEIHAQGVRPNNPPAEPLAAASPRSDPRLESVATCGESWPSVEIITTGIDPIAHCIKPARARRYPSLRT